jgi:hypothetical protein
VGPSASLDILISVNFDIEEENLQTSPLLPHSYLLAVGPVKVKTPC